MLQDLAALARILVTLIGLAIVELGARRAIKADDREATDEVARSFAIAVTVSVLIAPALYHHYLAVLVLPLILGLSAGVSLRWLAAAYLLMWGGEQGALGDASWVVNRLLPTLGALLLLSALIASRARVPAVARR